MHQTTTQPGWYKDYIRAAQFNLPAQEIKKLASHGHYRVRARVAEHPHASIQLLYSLAKDPHPEVRISLSGRKCLPAIILETLLNDECPEVRLELAENPHLELHKLHQLTQDDNPYVSERAWKTLRTVVERRKNWVSVLPACLINNTLTVACPSRKEDSRQGEFTPALRRLAS
ncbi:MAG TPA: hypothetical protein PKN86_09535 [Candidatus Obscuribacter sp.]|nr:hypothetical protein [Candidatus Obscuribacter sp.]HMX46000.1 hypothetical protein [Candidatus Obscuribacter sp.]HMY03473.1 hypothetical protein [Candidatus Obscuribacter sp.]HMY51724.1 hypothetical protein [Candidatus Obscuribacter sp.]HND67672.1 hypothetical protein [Candidatus Obscuribacter sp.]